MTLLTEGKEKVMKFSKTGDYLILGFNYGYIQLYRFVEKFNNIFTGYV